MNTPTRSPDFQTEIRDMWRTRPVRAADDRKLAGVCGGIGRRYGIDPILSRVAFVVAAFCGGAGIFLYALAWLLLRRTGDQASMGESLLGRGHASGSKFGAILLILLAGATIPSIGGTGATLFVGTGILATLAMLAGWYALHRQSPEPPMTWQEMANFRWPATGGMTPTGPGAAPSRPGAAPTESGSSPTESGSSPTEGRAAPAGEESASAAPASPAADSYRVPDWDPLGAAPFAWDLPAPGKAPEQPKRPKSRLTKITLGLALISVAVSVGLAQIFGLTWLTPTRIGAIALAVIGAGLLVGATIRRGHGLLTIAGPLAGFVLLSAMAVPQYFVSGTDTSGDRRIVLKSGYQLDTSIVHDVGSLTVDLTGLRLDRDRSLQVSNRLGSTKILLPPGLDLNAKCQATLGTVTCPQGMDYGNDGPNGPVLLLDVISDVGSVEVIR